MANGNGVSEVTKEIAEMPLGQLKKKYLEVFGEATKSNNKKYLFKQVAHRLQEKKNGGLSERAKKKAEELAKDAPIRRRLLKDDGKDQAAKPTKTKATKERDPRLPAAGTILKRKYEDKEHTVKVLDQGFDYRGETFRSLSGIAKKITGCSWNGFTFFDLAVQQEQSE